MGCMTLRVSLLVVLLLGTPARAEEEPIVLLEGHVLVEGRVVDPSGRPIAGAAVSYDVDDPKPTGVGDFDPIENEWVAAGRSKEDGTFRFQAPVAPIPGRPSTVAVSARADGFSFCSTMGSAADFAVEVVRARPLTLTLFHAGAVTGRLVAEDGQVLSETRILLWHTHVGGGFSATTDAEGRFRFADVPEGHHRVKVVREGRGVDVEPGIDVRPGETTDAGVVTVPDD